MDSVNNTTSVKKYFDKIANRYDLVNTLLSFGLHVLWRRRTILSADVAVGEVVLDVCAGTADLGLRACKKTGTSGHVIVYDFSMSMLARARSKQSRSGQLLLVCGDAEAIAVRTKSVDVVLIGFGLRNLQNMHLGIAEIYRVLKPGGRFVCLEFSRPNTVWLRILYDIYSFYVLPRIGGWLSGCSEAYWYLPASIRRFPFPDHLADILRNTGFVKVAYKLLAHGIAAIHTAVKRDDS